MADETKPSVDLQDPLPESNWLWRRVFTFCVTAAILWMLWGGITRLGAAAMLVPPVGIAALLTLCKWLIVFNVLMATYYMVAPSAEQITKMVKTAGLLRSGVQITGSQKVETAVSTTETATAAGLPPLPETVAPANPQNIAPVVPSERFQPPVGPDSGQPADVAPWPPR